MLRGDALQTGMLAAGALALSMLAGSAASRAQSADVILGELGGRASMPARTVLQR